MSLNCSLENPRRGNVFDVGFRIVGFCYGSFAFGNENHKTYTIGHLNPRGCLIGHPLLLNGANQRSHTFVCL